MSVEDWHGALYRRLFDCLVDAVLHVPGAHVVLPPHHLCHLGSPVAKLRGGSEVRSKNKHGYCFKVAAYQIWMDSHQ